MNILIIAGEASRSTITMGVESEGSVNDLPEKLRMRVLKVANKFNECGVTEALMDKDKNLHLTHGGENYFFLNNSLLPVFFYGITRKELIEIIEIFSLLYWYLSPHMRARDPGTLGGANVCCECGHVQQTGRAYSKYCEVPECASHTKWAEICEGYEPQKRQESLLAKMVQEVCGKQVPTVPTIGNAPNSWAEKC